VTDALGPYASPPPTADGLPFYPRVTDFVWSPDSQTLVLRGALWGRVSPGFLGVEGHWGRRIDDGNPALATTRSDLWLAASDGSLLRRVGASFQDRELMPKWSPGGEWIGCLVDGRRDILWPAVAEGPPLMPLELAVTRAGGEGISTVAAPAPTGEEDPWPRSVRAYTWADDDELLYLVGDSIHRVRLTMPEVPDLPTTSEREAREAAIVTGIVAAGSTLLAVGLGVLAWRRGPRLLTALRAAAQAHRLGYSPQALRALLDTLEDVRCRAHNLKNAARAIEPGAGGPSPTLARDVQVIQEHWRGVDEALGQVEAHHAAWRVAVVDFSDAVREGVGGALDQALEARSPLAEGVGGLAAEAARPDPSPEELSRLSERLTALLDGRRGLIRVAGRASRRFTIGDIIERALRRCESRADRLEVDLELDASAHSLAFVSGDPEPLVEVIGSLLDNALDSIERDTSDGPRGIWISVEGGDAVTVHIRDTGAGIDPGELHNLLSQPSSNGRTGLTSARTIVGRYPGGSLNLTSPGQGRGAEAEVRVGALRGP
jgi:signal transduction histidine kinase